MQETKAVNIKNVLLTIFMLLGIATSSVLVLFWFSRDFRNAARNHVAQVFGLKMEGHPHAFHGKFGLRDQSPDEFYQQLGCLLEDCNRYGLSSERKGQLCLAINQLKEWLHEYEISGSSRDPRVRSTKQQIEVLEKFIRKTKIVA